MTTELVAANTPLYLNAASTGIAYTSPMYIPCFAALSTASQVLAGASMAVLTSLPICTLAMASTTSPPPSMPASLTPPSQTAPACSAGLSLCNGACANLITDWDNCGACSTTCAAENNGCHAAKCQAFAIPLAPPQLTPLPTAEEAAPSSQVSACGFSHQY